MGLAEPSITHIDSIFFLIYTNFMSNLPTRIFKGEQIKTADASAIILARREYTFYITNNISKEENELKIVQTEFPNMTEEQIFQMAKNKAQALVSDLKQYNGQQVRSERTKV